MSVEQSRGPPAPTEVGFDETEEVPGAAVDGLAPPSTEPDEEEVVGEPADAADVVVAEPAAFFAPEDVELLHPAVSVTAARQAASAVPSRIPIRWLESEVFISSSMPCVAADARRNPTTFTA
ncbi:hypothetical protein ABH935_008216 [Catenulispora sp. GAS73]|uniref:hypothetical protein n=1 Tax=Catenulispora sp. GAS73 TaxID=3156269 RepID=UPI003514DB32